MTGGVFAQILKVSLTSSLLIGALLAIAPLLKARYRAKWRYAAWMVIALRLLVPVNFELPKAPLNFTLPGPAAASTAEYASPAANSVTVRRTDVSVAENQAAANAANRAEQPLSGSVWAFTAMDIAGFVWLAGIMLFLLAHVVSYRIFLHRLRSGGTAPAPDYVREILASSAAVLDIGNVPEVLLTDAVETPVLIGIFKARILLPRKQFEAGKLAFILRHELTHFKRKDLLCKLALTAANAAHWFNPLVYLMTSQASRDIELSCDDEVASGLDSEERAGYGSTILSAALIKRRIEPMFSTQFGSSKKSMKDRLLNLFDTRAKRRGRAALAAVAVCAVSVTGAVSFGYAADEVSAAVVPERPALIIPDEKPSSPVAPRAEAQTLPSAAADTGLSAQAPLDYLAVRIDDVDGHWAQAAAFEGGNMLEQLQAEMAWLEEAYAEHNTKFVITETIPELEVRNLERVQYLYDNSQVFREMSTMEGGEFIIESGSDFWLSGDSVTDGMIRRNVVMIPNDGELVLDKNIKMSNGLMSASLIGPQGEGVISSPVGSIYGATGWSGAYEGFWSVVRVYDEPDGSEEQISGFAELGLRLE